VSGPKKNLIKNLHFNHSLQLTINNKKMMPNGPSGPLKYTYALMYDTSNNQKYDELDQINKRMREIDIESRS